MGPIKELAKLKPVELVQWESMHGNKKRQSDEEASPDPKKAKALAAVDKFVGMPLPKQSLPKQKSPPPTVGASTTTTPTTAETSKQAVVPNKESSVATATTAEGQQQLAGLMASLTGKAKAPPPHPAVAKGPQVDLSDWE